MTLGEMRRKRPFAGRAEAGERGSMTVIRRRYADRCVDNLWWARADQGYDRVGRVDPDEVRE
jgi:hypothetical protein